VKRTKISVNSKFSLILGFQFVKICVISGIKSNLKLELINPAQREGLSVDLYEMLAFLAYLGLELVAFKNFLLSFNAPF
jgi:hypothetical protein